MNDNPNLELFQSLWAMEDLPYGSDTPWNLAEQLDRIAEAGFHGAAVDLGARGKPEAVTVAPLLRERGLDVAVFAFVRDDADLDAALRYADIVGARRMVVCGCVFDTDPVVLARIVERWHARCRAAGVDMQLETHRNTLTNDLRLTTRLLDELDPAVRLAIDLSHYVCSNEIPVVPTDEINGHLAKLFARAESLQGRIATRCQVQIPLGFPQHREWEELFQSWWVRAFAAIRASRAADGSDAPVMFCTELGTVPYALTDGTGRELSDRWHEALILKDRASEAFSASQTTLAPEGTSR